jgi:Ca-activated chloride channel family protein
MSSFVRNGFASPLGLILLAVLPALAILAWLARRRRQRALAELGQMPILEMLALGRGKLRLVRVTGLVLGLVLLVIGIAGPQWGRAWDQSTAPGRDLVVVVDLSRSMLAQDVLPNRLERAKEALADLSQAVQQRGGHRLALVGFAARARVFCPLTHDYDHFRAALAELDAAHPHADLRPASADPASGTRIGLGLLAAVEVQDPRFRGHQDILLISDGDDPARESEWRLGAAAAREHGIAVHTVGVGNPEAGSPIPLKSDSYLRYDNQVVSTRLEEQPLQDIARLTGGTYTPARTQALPLGDLFRERLEPQSVREENDDALPVYRQRYAWFLAAAFLFLGLEMVLGQSRPRRGRAEAAAPLARPRIGWLHWLPLLLLGAAPLADVDELLREGNAAFHRGDFRAAVRFYEQAEVDTPDPGLIAYNKAAALYRQGDYREAELHYRRSLEDADVVRLPRVLYDLGNCLVQRAERYDVALLEEALRCYERCLTPEPVDAAFAGDVRHNLELAKLLWLKAKAAKEERDRHHPGMGDDDPNPPGNRNEFLRGSDGDRSGADPLGKAAARPSQPGDTAFDSAKGDGKPPPGKGNLPPLPDDEDLVALSPEDTVEHLRRATLRIVHERQEHRQRTASQPFRNGMDW